MHITTITEKKERLFEQLDRLCRSDVALAFSGGVDSSLLLSLLKEFADANGTKVTAVTADTALHPHEDCEISARVCRETGVDHRIIRIDEFSDAGIEDNPPDRCYRCKLLIFKKIKEEAESIGASYILDGTNLDDTKVYRPGLKALSELGIISPLKDAGFTKDEVRRLAAERGLSTASRPAAPCLATRFPYGTHLTLEKLQTAENGEKYLKSLGLYNVRLRIHDDIARIETDPESFEIITAHRTEISERLKTLGLRFITLDLEGFRSGSFDK